jgi:hypothetical protein
VAGLLVWPTASFLAAPYNSLSAQHAALPPDLGERRRTEYLRYGKRRLTFAVGGLGLAGGAAALTLGLFVPGPANITAPQIVGPARGLPVRYGPVTPSQTTSSQAQPNHSSKQTHSTTTKASTTPTTTSTTPATTSATTPSTTPTAATTSTASATTPAPASTTSTTP